jgi:hypothetical protein
MATYRELVGKKIKKVTSDPSDSIDGQMWYNSTTGAIRGLAINEGWSSAPSLGTGAYLAGSFGTQTAGVKICGTKHPGTPISNVEHYNGTGWSEETNYPTAAQSVSGAGTQTAGIAAGGLTPSQTSAANYYDGTSWTSANSLPYTANNLASCGLTQSSVIYAVGRDGSSGNSGTNKSITFDGTNFANGPNHVTTRMFNTVSGAGTGTAALIVGGFIDPSPNAMTNCEEYDGTSWSATGSLNVATGFASAWGTQTNAVTQNSDSNSTGSEAYNGSTWSALPPTGAPSSGGLYGITAGATGDAGWLSAINPSGTVYATSVEFNRSTNVITAAAWASGGNMNTGRYSTGAGGSQTAAIAFGGYDSSTSGKTEEYDGTSWTENNDMGTGRFYTSGSGTQTAALAVAGRTGPGPNFAKAVVEEYDGTSWSEQNDIPSDLNGMMGAGTQTAAVHFGGIATPGGSSSTGTLEYDGTNWTSGGALPTGAKYGIGVGTQTAALHAGGGALGSYYYDGSSWSDQSSNLLTQNNPLGIFFAGMSGTQTSALIAGGGNPSTGVTATDAQGWNGTSWFTQPSLGTARNAGNQGGVGTATAGIAFGGQGSAPPYAVQNTTEEFTGETTAGNVETFSTS